MHVQHADTCILHSTFTLAGEGGGRVRGEVNKEGVVFGAWLSQGKTYLCTGQPGRVFFFSLFFSVIILKFI